MKQALIEFLSDSYHWLVGIFVGLVGKISYDIAMKRTMNFLQWLAVIVLSVMVGYLTARFCEWKHWMTLFGEKIIVYLMTNYKPILDAILKRNK
jgi:hypothetical protein